MNLLNKKIKPKPNLTECVGIFQETSYIDLGLKELFIEQGGKYVYGNIIRATRCNQSQEKLIKFSGSSYQRKFSFNHGDTQGDPSTRSDIMGHAGVQENMKGWWRKSQLRNQETKAQSVCSPLISCIKGFSGGEKGGSS